MTRVKSLVLGILLALLCSAATGFYERRAVEADKTTLLKDRDLWVERYHKMEKVNAMSMENAETCRVGYKRVLDTWKPK